ncbi:MAG: translation initiation factor 2 [Pseudomonadota bacterium]
MKTAMTKIALLAALTMTSACATIDRGTSEPFEIRTSPSGATARTSLGKGCAPTPCVIPNVSREADFTVTVEKPGYKTRSYKVMHARSEGASGHIIPNVFMTGGVGLVVDANNGSTQELVPNPLVVTLEADTRGAQASTKRVADGLLDWVGRQD